MLGSADEFTKQVHIFLIFLGLLIRRRLFGAVKLERHVREALIHASMLKIIEVVVQYFCM